MFIYITERDIAVRLDDFRHIKVIAMADGPSVLRWQVKALFTHGLYDGDTEDSYVLKTFNEKKEATEFMHDLIKKMMC